MDLYEVYMRELRCAIAMIVGFLFAWGIYEITKIIE